MSDHCSVEAWRAACAASLARSLARRAQAPPRIGRMVAVVALIPLAVLAGVLVALWLT